MAGWQHAHHIAPDSTLWTRWTLPGDEAALGSARATLGEDAFRATWAAGLHLSLDHALEAALAVVEPGRSAAS